MRKILERCPTCGGDLAITMVQCQQCATEVRSRYAPCPFCRLADDQITFLMLFIENRGNLSELEKQLGVSYPTIRNKLDEITQIVRGGPAAGSAPAPEVERRQRIVITAEPPPPPTPPSPPPAPEPAATDDSAAARRAILEQIASGQLDPAVGLEQLRHLEEGR